MGTLALLPTMRVAARSMAAGVVAGLVLLAIYVGLVALAQDLPHALSLLRADRWFVGALTLGFGTQVALFVHLRIRQAHLHHTGVASSAGASTVAMVACCAHHAAEVLPLLGLTGAAGLLGAYKAPLLWFAVVLNLAGIAYLLHQLRASGTRAPTATSRQN